MNRIIALAVVGLLASGCASQKLQPDPAYAPVAPQAPVPAERNHGAIYQAAHSISLFEDIKARRVGDILTIVLTENTNATKQASTTTKKENELALQNPTLLGSPAQINLRGSVRGAFPLQDKTNNNLEVGIDTNQEFNGTGSSSQSNRLTGSITVTVAEVLSNGNLVVRGEKLLAINEGDEYVRLSGIVRPQDIRPDNTVLSTQVAHARISYGGNGAVADASSHGWLSRFFLKWWPF